MKRYLLDTNIVAAIAKADSNAKKKVAEIGFSNLFISSITLAELRYGLAKKPEAKRLHQVIDEFINKIGILSFNDETSYFYGQFRAEIEKQGLSLSALDMLIAAHAQAENMILVSNDQAFFKIPNLMVEDWTCGS